MDKKKTLGGFTSNGATLNNSFSGIKPLQKPTQQMSSLVQGILNPTLKSNYTALTSGQFGSTGNIQGQSLAITNPHGEPTKPTIQKDVAGNSYQAPKSNPSVLAQQQALNKLGAGLVEDGLAGPKTREAIAKYGTKATTSAPTSSTTQTPPPVKPPKPTTPQVGTTAENAQNVLNTGNQTPLEQTAMSNLYQAGQMTPEEIVANEEVRKANELQKSYQNVGALSPYAEASMYADRARTPEEIQAIQQAPDLAGRASSTYGLTNSLSNIYGSSRVAGAGAALQGIQTAAGRGLSAAQSGLSGAQTQAGRAQSGAGTVFGASIPGQISGSSRLYNPLDPTGANSGTSGIIQGANNQSVYDLTNRYNEGKVAIEQAQGIENQIANTLLSNPDINNQPLSLITNLNQYLSGQLGTAPQQLLAQQVQNYIQTLGLDPASVVSIATQQKGTLKQLLKSLKDTATNNNEALKATADSLGNSNSSGGSTGGNMFGSFFGN